MGEVLKGGFYEHEIRKSNVGDVYLVEKLFNAKGTQYTYVGSGSPVNKTHGYVRKT